MNTHDGFGIYEDTNKKLINFVIEEFKSGCTEEEELLNRLCKKFTYLTKEEIIERLDENS